MVYCDGADGSVRIATVDKVTCLQAVPAGEPGELERSRLAASDGAPPPSAVGVFRPPCEARSPAHQAPEAQGLRSQATGSMGTISTPPRTPAALSLPAGVNDGVLRWFEAYADALSSGRFAVEVRWLGGAQAGP